MDVLTALRRKTLLNKPRSKRVLGLSLGERSVLIAEVVGGDRVQLMRTAEMAYPEGMAPTDSAALGGVLATYLVAQGFSAKSAVVGLPARWLVTQPKEVPAADAKTVAEMLRLSAEAEFSTELKDLVYDYTGSGTFALLVATPRRYVEAAQAICQAAKLDLMSVTATALALGEATGRAAAKDVLVLNIACGGAEMTMQRDAHSGALRHLRSPKPEAPFINELRRTVSMMPSSRPGRQLILWDGTGMAANILGDQIGVQVRGGDLALLGVSSSANGATTQNGTNGQYAGQYAAAVALALEGISEQPATVDFLRSKLATPKQTRIPRWAIIAAAALVVLVFGAAYAFHDLHEQESELDARQVQYDGMKSRVDDASAFVSKVSFALAWHGGDPRYLACVRDMTVAMSEDFDTFATDLIIGDAPRPTNSKVPDTHALTGVLAGKAADQQHVLSLRDRLTKFPGFVDVTLGGAEAGRGREVTFSMNFKYQAAKPAQ
jgi:hypothetical protein